MKGPYERLKYDLRRLWKCPACNRVERTSGGSTYCLCTCQVKANEGAVLPMVLVEDNVRRVLGPPNATTDDPASDPAAPDSPKPDSPKPDNSEPDEASQVG